MTPLGDLANLEENRDPKLHPTTTVTDAIQKLALTQTSLRGAMNLRTSSVKSSGHSLSLRSPSRRASRMQNGLGSSNSAGRTET